MKLLVLLLALVLLFVPAFGGESPDSRWADGMDLSWAFPETAPNFPPGDSTVVKHVPESTKSYTQAQIDDNFNPPDWFPDEHMPFPPIIARGEGKATPGCVSCHLASGIGHPENANLTGLTAAYLLTQIHNFQQGLRTDPRHRMTDIAKGMTEEDAKEASAYFASLKPMAPIKVVETDTVPGTYIKGNRRYVNPDAGMEPIGQRIIEVPEDVERIKERDPHCGFVAYVPPGSVAKGEELAKTGGEGKTTACIACHGPALKGVGSVPRIAGHSPTYIVRQLAGFQVGARTSEMAQLMKDVVANLTQDDLVSLAAYLASLNPEKQ